MHKLGQSSTKFHLQPVNCYIVSPLLAGKTLAFGIFTILTYYLWNILYSPWIAWHVWHLHWFSISLGPVVAILKPQSVFHGGSSWFEMQYALAQCLGEMPNLSSASLALLHSPFIAASLVCQFSANGDSHRVYRRLQDELLCNSHICLVSSLSI